MKNLSNIEIKGLFVSSMKRAYDFSCEPDNPFLMNLSNEEFFVILKTISPACFKNRPDVTRVQLHHNLIFKKILKAKIPVIILGYDSKNDVFVNWNPDEIQKRLNAKRIVSLYSRKSIQKSVKGKEFKEVVLTTGGKIIAFKRHLLIDFFKDWQNLYDFEETNNSVRKPTKSKVEQEETSTHRVFEVTDKEITRKMIPLLKGNRVLEAATLCYKHYASKHRGMKIKDWLNIANDMYASIHKV